MTVVDAAAAGAIDLLLDPLLEGVQAGQLPRPTVHDDGGTFFLHSKVSIHSPSSLG